MIAVGFVAKTGSAVAVALTLEPRPRIVDRRPLDLAPDVDRFVYHAAQALGRDAARSVRDATKKIERAARNEVGTFLRDTGNVVGAAIVGSSLTMPGSLDDIIASHTRVHTAEGVLYRSVIADALAAHGVEATLVSADDLKGHTWVLDALGKVPSPWRKEHKDATCAAALLLNTSRSRRSRPGASRSRPSAPGR